MFFVQSHIKARKHDRSGNFEFLRKLRQTPGLADVAIFALTGFGRPEDVEQARASGFYSHITKPF
jgi:CheY-like chemotaxis protein